MPQASVGGMSDSLSMQIYQFSLFPVSHVAPTACFATDGQILSPTHNLAAFILHSESLHQSGRGDGCSCRASTSVSFYARSRCRGQILRYHGNCGGQLVSGLRSSCRAVREAPLWTPIAKATVSFLVGCHVSCPHLVVLQTAPSLSPPLFVAFPTPIRRDTSASRHSPSQVSLLSRHGMYIIVPFRQWSSSSPDTTRSVRPKPAVRTKLESHSICNPARDAAHGVSTESN